MNWTAFRFRWMICFLAMAVIWAEAFGQQIGDPRPQQVDEHLAAGEFAAAIGAIQRLPQSDRDPVLAQIASAQTAAGETVAAGATAQGIQSPQSLSELASAPASGGGSFADFQSLIDLIQTTVVPDTWEALGGPSTMAPYPQGVYVDASGTVLQCESLARSDAIEDLKSLLARSERASAIDASTAWRQPAALRCVSLRRLTDQWTRWRLEGIDPSEAMLHLAGISHVQYLFFENDDIVLAGPVGGIEEVDGWYRDRQSGLNTLRFDFFRTCLESALQRQPFGCTIDPTQQGLQRAAAVGKAIQQDKVPIGKAAEEMVEALGMQRVEVFGTAGDTPIGYVMVEADRHMKQLALGIQPMPRGGINYLDAIDAAIDQGPPSELLLRLWFTSAPRAVRVDEDHTVFELAGVPVRLSGQNERAVASGQRGHVTEDFRTVAFVDDFNKNWHAIRSQYPIYGALESIYQSASIAELIRRFASAPDQQRIAAILAGSSSESDYVLPTPRQVESIAVLHTVRHGNQRHQIVLASGGVRVDSSQTIPSRLIDYPSLHSMSASTHSIRFISSSGAS
ncbi:MAG: DUF1598 domain-containing protein, partial [Planctomycetes bacterium]|nr:DUF1598 domain-containing protein [Planctomycetota bacterium]